MADREGRLEDRPKRLKGELFAYDSHEVEPLLVELAERGFIERYVVDGLKVIHVTNFAKHQSPHFKEQPSALPPPPRLGLCADAMPSKPEAQPSSNEAEARGQPEANPRHASGNGAIERGSNRADSGFLISDTGYRSKKPSASSAAPTVPCPYDRIVGLYHELLPSLPRVKLMPAARQKALRKVWGWILSSTKSDGARRALTAEEAIEWLRGYFVRAAENDFLMGRTPRSAEHANWSCDLDFLLTDKGMKQVIEKTQERAA